MKTPYLRFNEEKLIENYKNFNKECKEIFKDNFKICFSTKTNSNPLTIKTLSSLNSGFEVASLKEINLIPKNTFVTMNGPAKTPEELTRTVEQNILLQVDSFSELEKIKEIINNSPLGGREDSARRGMVEYNSRLKTKPKEVMIRLGKDNSKFGFSKNQVPEVIEKIENLKINFAGFQLHQGTLNKFKDFQNTLKEQKKIIKPYLNKIKYLNFGGGFPDNFQLKNRSIKLGDYLKEIKNIFKEFKGTFIFEPGRNLASDAYTLITKVITIKEKDKINYAILDAGINILSKLTLSSFKFNKISSKINNPEKSKTYTLAGPLLFNNDILGKWHGKLKEGDLFEVENLGAYCENLAWEIIYDKPKIKTQ